MNFGNCQESKGKSRPSPHHRRKIRVSGHFAADKLVRKLIAALSCGLFLASHQASARRQTGITVGIEAQLPTLDLRVQDRGVTSRENEAQNRVLLQTQQSPIAGIFVEYHGLRLTYAENTNPKESQGNHQQYAGLLSFRRLAINFHQTVLDDFVITKAEGSPELESLTAREKDRDLYVAATSLNTYASVLNFGLDLSHLFDITAAKQHTGGGLLAIIAADQVTIEGREQAHGSLLPPRTHDIFGDDGSFHYGHFSSINGGIGWGQIIAVAPIYVHLLAAVSSGQARWRYQTPFNARERTSQAHKIYGLLGVGYHSGRFFAGCEATSESPEYQLNSLSIATNRTIITVSTGLVI